MEEKQTRKLSETGYPGRGIPAKSNAVDAKPTAGRHAEAVKKHIQLRKAALAIVAWQSQRAFHFSDFRITQALAGRVREVVREDNRSSSQFRGPGLCHVVLHPSSPAHHGGHQADSVLPNLFPILHSERKIGQ